MHHERMLVRRYIYPLKKQLEIPCQIGQENPINSDEEQNISLSLRIRSTKCTFDLARTIIESKLQTERFYLILDWLLVERPSRSTKCNSWLCKICRTRFPSLSQWDSYSLPISNITIYMYLSKYTTSSYYPYDIMNSNEIVNYISLSEDNINTFYFYNFALSLLPLFMICLSTFSFWLASCLNL